MTPTSTLLDRLAVLLSQDTSTLAAALAMHVHLAKAPFTPGPGLTPGSFTEADFQGYTTLNPTAGNQQAFNDPSTGDRIVQMVEPGGGWHWQTSGVLNLPQTIYGYYLTDNANGVLYGSALLTNPIVLTASGQGLDVGQIKYDMPPGVIT